MVCGCSTSNLSVLLFDWFLQTFLCFTFHLPVFLSGSYHLPTRSLSFFFPLLSPFLPPPPSRVSPCLLLPSSPLNISHSSYPVSHCPAEAMVSTDRDVWSVCVCMSSVDSTYSPLHPPDSLHVDSTVWRYRSVLGSLDSFTSCFRSSCTALLFSVSLPSRQYWSSFICCSFCGLSK